jgi:hypothetical protein
MLIMKSLEKKKGKKKPRHDKAEILLKVVLNIYHIL